MNPKGNYFMSKNPYIDNRMKWCPDCRQKIQISPARATEGEYCILCGGDLEEYKDQGKVNFADKGDSNFDALLSRIESDTD